MKRKFIPADESFARWKKDPRFVAAYNALEAEFALAASLIKARSEADMTQEQVAQAMGTTQAVVASSVLIILMDFLVTQLMIGIFGR